MAHNFLTAEWKNLAIANYAIDPAVLRPFLPFRTELDYFNNHCFVSLVAFQFINTRLKGVAIPFHQHFEEINLRFYIKHKSAGEWRRGVTFIKEIVPKPMLTFVANVFYGEKYVTMPIRHRITSVAPKLHVSYSWKHRKQWDSFSMDADIVAKNFSPGSEEEFITEHYWGYTSTGKEKSSEYQVAHPAWRMHQVNSYEVNVRFGELYGECFSVLDNSKPVSVMLAEGSVVSVKTAASMS